MLMARMTAICQLTWLTVIIPFDQSFIAFLSFATFGVALQLSHAAVRLCVFAADARLMVMTI